MRQRDVLLLSHADLGHGVVRQFRQMHNGRWFFWLYRWIRGLHISELDAENMLSDIAKQALVDTLSMLEGGGLLHFSLGDDGEDCFVRQILVRLHRSSERKREKFGRALLRDIKRTLRPGKILVLHCWTISCERNQLSVTRFPL